MGPCCLFAAELSKQLGEVTTWSKYYSSKESKSGVDHHDVEWFATYENMKPHIDDALKLPSSSSLENNTKQLVLDVGCGISHIGPAIARDHPGVFVHCLDVSVESLRMLASTAATECSFVKCDVSESLPYADASVTLVVDKGTTDAVMRGREHMVKLTRMFAEQLRVLRRGGSILQVTTDHPEERCEMLRRYCSDDGVAVSYRELDDVVGSQLPVYLYVITKT